MLISTSLHAQNVGVNEDGSSPHPTSILEVKSSSKGMLIPRLTDVQRIAISNPAKGLMLYNLDTDCLNFYNGTQWVEYCGIPICNPAPTSSAAGNDQLNVIGVKTTLSANTPTEGTGSWVIISGDGGTLDSVNLPNSVFRGIAGNLYVLRWIISNDCRSTQDEVVISFLPPPCGAITSVTDIDGIVYPTVSIGSQCWTAENLKTTKYADGTAIPNQQVQATWVGLTSGAWCNFDNVAANNATYGKLYNWFAVNNNKKLCPTGWHVPTDSEWTIMVNFLGGNSSAGGALKSTGALWTAPNVGATNESGFSGMPGGLRNYLGNFNFLNTWGYYWTATENDATKSWGRNMTNSTTASQRVSQDKQVGFSVRCVKD